MPVSFKYTIWALFILPLVFIACKTSTWNTSYHDFLPKKEYIITYKFSYENKGRPTFIKAYIPQSNEHQWISSIHSHTPDMELKTLWDESGTRARWDQKLSKVHAFQRQPQSLERLKIHYKFTYSGRKVEYLLDDHLPVHQEIPDSLKSYLLPETYIQSDDSDIMALANGLSKDHYDLKRTLQSLFSYTYQIPRIKSSKLMDAKTCLKENRASCNGRSRLFVAMCRSLGIPARLVGGIILENKTKRTSHQWMEVYIQGEWVPFDALNGHFASIPAHYMELYRGDHFLITHSPNIDFDYTFQIEGSTSAGNPSQSSSEVFIDSGTFFWPDKLLTYGLPRNFLKLLLLLPLLGLIVALCKNIVGLKTIGTFLPAILGVSFEISGLGFGIIILATVVLSLFILSKGIESWGLLQTPRLVILLTGVIASLILVFHLSLMLGYPSLLSTSFFPIVILTLIAERFTRKVDESDLKEGMMILGQTILVAFACYLAYASPLLETLFFTFPELILAVLAFNLLLGKWIGLRITEYVRFKQLLA